MTYRCIVLAPVRRTALLVDFFEGLWHIHLATHRPIALPQIYEVLHNDKLGVNIPAELIHFVFPVRTMNSDLAIHTNVYFSFSLTAPLPVALLQLATFCKGPAPSSPRPQNGLAGRSLQDLLSTRHLF